MPIVQVSRITQRKGLEEDLPQPLAGAELGWAVDQRRLYIGNGTLAEGAPIVGNTEILTEFSDILSYANSYTYRGDAAGYTAQTGADPSTPVSQSLQARLDSFVVVTDFGATGDGVTDDTAAINRALFQLYCRQTNTQIRRGLYFPAGEYVITNTLLIPPYAFLYGDGANSSVISFRVLAWVAGTLYAAGVLVRDNATGTYYRSLIPVDDPTITLANTTYWQAQTLPPYVARTADSQQQTGLNIGINAVTPRNVEINHMRFQTSIVGDGIVSHDIFLVEKAVQCTLRGVNFAGTLPDTDPEISQPNLSALVFSSTTSLPCTDITVDDCSFRACTRGIEANEFTKGVTISNSRFDTLYQGVRLGSPSPVDGGPTGFRILHNTFDRIYEEGVSIENCSLNATGYNTFYDVGNQFNGVGNPAGPIISIDADQNISVGDLFQRTQSQALSGAGYPRVRLFNSTTGATPVAMALSSADQIQLGSMTHRVMPDPIDSLPRTQMTVLDGIPGQTLFQFNTAISRQNGGFWSFDMPYTVVRFTAGTQAVRKGVLTVVAGGDDSAGEGIVYTDDFIDNETTDTVLIATESSNVVSVAISAEATGFDGVIYYGTQYQA